MRNLALGALAAATLLGCSTGPAEVGGQPPAAGPTPIVAAAIRNPAATVADYLACLRDHNVMMLSAHRGGPVPGYPENAIETFAHTLGQAPMLIETDVRRTADGVLVLMHDETLQRTTTAQGPIAEIAAADLAQARLLDNDARPTPFAAPTLSEALAWARGRTILQLDVKSGAPIQEVARAVIAADAQAFAAVIAYTEVDALAAAAVDPRLTISVQILDLATLDRLEAQGLPAYRIMAWTGIEVERPELWRALNARGVSAAWGSLWYLDQRVLASGDMTAFAGLAEQGLDILSSDLHQQAYAAAAARQDAPEAIAACNQTAGRPRP
jgi:glycerophosphoryl diester phosphodiesterase